MEIAFQIAPQLVALEAGPNTSAPVALSRRVQLLQQSKLKFRPTVQLKPDSMFMKIS